MSTNSAQWITTKQLMRSPFKYLGKLLYLGSDYSLIVELGKKVEIGVLPIHIFSRITILNYVKVDDAIYVIITVDSAEHFRAINDRFRNAGMVEHPILMDDNGLINLITYYVTAILPDGEHQSFIQTIPC